MLPNGTIAWSNRIANDYEIRSLDGTLIRTVNTVGNFANAHDMQLLPNGDYLLGAYVPQDHVDTSAYGGSSDATVVNAELQEVSSTGSLVWDWKSQDHIGLAETNRFWHWAVHNPRPEGYDIVHWNSIAPDGDNAVIASFRHLDAVYKINKATGAIVWKLGGTKTPKSLKVHNDPLPVHVRRPARRAPAPRRDPDRVRRSHPTGQPGAPRGALPDRPADRNRDARCNRSPTPTSPRPTAAGRLGACRTTDWLIVVGQGQPDRRLHLDRQEDVPAQVQNPVQLPGRAGH